MYLKSCSALGAESSLEESCGNTSSYFENLSYFPHCEKEFCWQSADSAFIGSLQLGSEEVCNHRLWVVHSTCTCGYFTGVFILHNCLSWKLAIIFIYTHILYSHKYTVKKHRNRNTKLSHLLIFCVNSWIICINLQELQAPLLVLLSGTRQVIFNFFGFPELQLWTVDKIFSSTGLLWRIKLVEAFEHVSRVMLSNSAKLFLSHHLILWHPVFSGAYLIKEIIHKCSLCIGISHLTNI